MSLPSSNRKWPGLPRLRLPRPQSGLPAPAGKLPDIPLPTEGSTGELRIFQQLSRLGIPFTFDANPNPRFELNGIPASFVVGQALVINVADTKYGPVELAKLESTGLEVIELTEAEALTWKYGED